MPRYVRNEAGYERTEFEARKIRKAVRGARGLRKKPTSVALDPELVEDLKREAQARGVPYQVLMRMFIVEGFKRLKRTR
jgi:predicted DNA binding CopG/RHH family protein